MQLRWDTKRFPEQRLLPATAAQPFLPEKMTKPVFHDHDRAEIRRTHGTCRFSKRKIPDRQWHLAMRTCCVKSNSDNLLVAARRQITDQTNTEQTAKWD